MSSNTKCNSGFLKAGLSLEYVTSNILYKNGHAIFGKYQYIRLDETKQLKEFSVDIRAHKCLDPNDKLIVLSTLTYKSLVFLKYQFRKRLLLKK